MGDEIKKKLQEEEYTADSYNSWLESRHSDPKKFNNIRAFLVLRFFFLNNKFVNLVIYLLFQLLRTKLLMLPI